MIDKRYFHIVLVGAGKIGIRHLEGICKIKRKIKISVVDNSNSSIMNSKKISKKINNKKIFSIEFFSTIKEIKNNADLAIVATNSLERLKVIKELLNKIKFDYIIIEKVPFVSIKEFQHFIYLSKKYKFRGWVNQPGRLQNFYIDLKKQFSKEKKISIYCNSGNYYIGSNALHLLDRLAFLTNNNDIKVDASLLFKKTFKSKRKNYIEFKGILKATTSRGDKLLIDGDINSKKMTFLNITSPKYTYVIFPSLNKVYFSEVNKRKIKEIKYNPPLVSDTTFESVKEIIDKGSCKLTSINESYLINKAMLKEFIKHLEKIKGKKIYKCLIT